MVQKQIKTLKDRAKDTHKRSDKTSKQGLEMFGSQRIKNIN